MGVLLSTRIKSYHSTLFNGNKLQLFHFFGEKLEVQLVKAYKLHPL